jgi:tRNA A-37 threonylcarbamoyl transferase component Bud32
METDATMPGMSGPHPTIAELRESSHPNIAEHLAHCDMCRSVVAAADDEPPIPLSLPKGLVSEDAFRWPADPIARGGMAQIFAGEDKRLGRTVMLKAPREDEGLSPGMAEMFVQRVTAEARVLAKLQHPAIVTIYELGKSTVGWPFCVLEKVDGISLRDRLDELAEAEDHGKSCTRERLELLSSLVGIAEALAYAHERRIVHRDVTPNNILLGKRGEATLIDWGIARDLDAPSAGTDPTLHDDPSATGRMVTISAGTPPYMPLEQSQGRKADPSFDVYSFGITLYEVVGGKTPFVWQTARSVGGKTAQIDAFLAWLQSEDPVPPAMPRDRELSGIIDRAMSRDPGHRFTADELVRALKQYLTGDLVFSHRYSLIGRAGRWASRHRAATVSVLFVIAAAIGGAFVWAQLQRQAKEEADLRVTASAAQVDASEKGRAADQAQREAEAAKAAAAQAEREGKDAQALKREADRKRKAADEMRHAAETAATQAKGTADEAVKRFEQAMRDKDEADKQRDQAHLDRDAARSAQAQAEREREAARASQAAAEKDREAAKAARDAADKERDAARATALAAEGDRDAARGARDAADKERDAAKAGRDAADKERDAANGARSAVERERDELKRKIAELEQKLRDKPPGPPP